MSYFLFGVFNTTDDKKLLQQVKLQAKERNVYIWFDEDITFYDEIQRMLREQAVEGNVSFAVTSKNQPHNSSDLLFPFDKFSNEELFADKSREFYKKCCQNNLAILFNCLDELVHLLNIEQMKIFVVEGYDDNFQKKICNMEELKEDLLYQIENFAYINSCMYCMS